MDFKLKEAILAVINGHEIMLDDDDDQEQVHILKTAHFSEFIVPNFPDNQFRQHFRMNPETFEDFFQKLQITSEKPVSRGHPEISLEKQLLMTLWCLSNSETFR